MSQWTQSARAKLEEYFARMRQSLKASGADVNEVVEDLRRHVEEEVAALKLVAVTEQDVGNILTRIGGPQAAIPEPLTALSLARSAVQTDRPKEWPRWRLLIFGVLLPFGTIGFEFFTGACAGIFFDPIPTIPHLLLALSVPVINLVIWVALEKEELRWRRQLGWAAGFAIGVAMVYGLLFLPLSPFAILGIVFYGIGLLPLAPALAMVSALHLRTRLKESAGQETRLPGLWPGLGLGLGALLLATLPMIMTEIGLSMASSESAADSKRGVSLLRTWGNEEEMLRYCYGRVGRGTDLYSWRTEINPESARLIYYRVTGKPFNAVPPPKLYAGRARFNLIEEEFTWDNDQAGDAVAGRVRGLSLKSSRLDGFVDPEGALAYLEWTLEFKNDSRLQREARAQIGLPPGAVVSRLTLWIDGEEREAAFGGRGQVKAAYKEVVTKRRDPVLVTTAGPDRILLQCFPVPPHGGVMKVRFGITAPLEVAKIESGFLQWPHFVERNFTISEEFRHSLWIEANEPFDSVATGLKAEQPKSGTFALRGGVREQELASPQTSLRVRRAKESRQVWATDTRNGAGAYVVRQRLTEKPVSSPSRIAMVVDGTQGMEEHYALIADAIKALPAGIELMVVLARDGVEELSQPVGTSDRASQAKSAERLRKCRGIGGHDNVPALIRAWDFASGSRNGVIVWIHGPQPLLLDAGEELRQRFERRPGSVRLLELQTHVGPNRVVEKLDGLDAVRVVTRQAGLGEDLQNLFVTWSGGTEMELVRERIKREDFQESGQGHETSLHLARLWAAGEVSKLAQLRQITEATRLAGIYQLVTSVSGAVVLETKAQFDRAGLKPVSPETVPTVPEPSALALLILGIAILGWMRYLKAKPRAVGRKT